MPSYVEWNLAIAQYVTAGVPRGASVFLSIDDLTLERIWGALLNQPIDTPLVEIIADFVAGVRAVCVFSMASGDSLNLRPLSGQEIGVPRCLGFLTAMVLSEYRRMGEETEDGGRIDEQDYFRRFRHLLLRGELGEEEGGRPEGMAPPGVEERLWLAWNQWIEERGWIPSAHGDDGGPLRYLRYPRSQVLLRRVEQERLEERLRDAYRKGELTSNLDRTTLGAALRGLVAGSNMAQFRALATETDPQRYAAFVDAAFEVYASVNWAAGSAGDSTPANRTRRGMWIPTLLSAGLYRVDDRILGTVDYLVYPEQPRHVRGSQLRLRSQDEDVVLEDHLYHPGWFTPVGPGDFTQGGLFPLSGDAHLERLQVPQKEFWVLVRDETDPDSGVFASWHSPDLKETFLLVVEEAHKERYTRQLSLLREEGLLIWDHERMVEAGGGRWQEFRECMVLSQAWDQLTAPICPELCEALKPRWTSSLRFRNGLRAPGGSGWMEGYLPEAMVVVVALRSDVRLRIHDLGQAGEMLLDEAVEVNQWVPLHCQLRPGCFRIEATAGGRPIRSAAIRVFGWDQLEPHGVLASGANTTREQEAR
jgi:hypothetical protein